MLTTDGPVPLHAQIRDQLRDDIAAGRLPPMTKIPSEAQLGEFHKVSRVTVRQALAALQSEGLIFRVQGKGAFVSQPKARQDVTTLKGFNEAMEPFGHVTRNRVLSFEEVPAQRHVAERLGIEEAVPVIKIRRLRFLNALPVSVDESYLPVDLGRALASADLDTRDVFSILENNLSTELGKAHLSIEAAEANSVNAALLGVTKGTPLLRIERLTFSAEGRPIDFEYLLYRSDRFRFELSIHRTRPAAQ